MSVILSETKISNFCWTAATLAKVAKVVISRHHHHLVT